MQKPVGLESEPWLLGPDFADEKKKNTAQDESAAKKGLRLCGRSQLKDFFSFHQQRTAIESQDLRSWVELHRIEATIDIFTRSCQPNDNHLTAFKDLIDDAVGGALNGEMQRAQQSIFALQGCASVRLGCEHLCTLDEKPLDSGGEFFKEGQSRFIDVEGVGHAII